MFTFGQDTLNVNHLSAHLGFCGGILDKTQNSLATSLHYSYQPGKVFHFESKLFFEYHQGLTFLTGNRYKESIVGIAPGVRINLFPKKNWSPSVVVFPAVMYHSRESAPNYEKSSFKFGLSSGISHRFYSKNMITYYGTIAKGLVIIGLKYGRIFHFKSGSEKQK